MTLTHKWVSLPGYSMSCVQQEHRLLSLLLPEWGSPLGGVRLPPTACPDASAGAAAAAAATAASAVSLLETGGGPGSDYADVIDEAMLQFAQVGGC